jgi:hypothetical protein
MEKPNCEVNQLPVTTTKYWDNKWIINQTKAI